MLDQRKIFNLSSRALQFKDGNRQRIWVLDESTSTGYRKIPSAWFCGIVNIYLFTDSRRCWATEVNIDFNETCTRKIQVFENHEVFLTLKKATRAGNKLLQKKLIRLQKDVIKLQKRLGKAEGKPNVLEPNGTMPTSKGLPEFFTEY